MVADLSDLTLKRILMKDLALKLQGVPYIYGGSNPHYGFDCSGFVIWVLQVFGFLPSGDWRADDLMHYFGTQLFPSVKIGDLVFYGTDDHAVHVMMSIGIGMVIGASGGGQLCNTEEEAKRLDAKVKIKKILYRSDFICCRDISKMV